MVKNINKIISLLRKPQNKLPRAPLITIYKSFVRPPLDYEDILYDQTFNNSFHERLESIQYNAAPAITGAIRGSSRVKLYQELGFESLQIRRWYRKLCLFFKVIKNQSSKYLFELIPTARQAYMTRHKNSVSLLNVKYDYSDDTVNWFHSYLTNRAFLISIESKYSRISKISCDVLPGSILYPLLFLIYVNHIKQAVSSDLLLYADDSCLIFQHKHVTEIEKHLNNDFSNLCEWFLDNKLSIHFGEDKTKSILFGSKRKLRKVGKLNITYQGIDIKQNSQVTYLGCILDETMSGEPMAYKTIKKINSRLNYLFRKKHFLTTSLRRLLCNALIQPHFDYACTAWYPNLCKKLKNKIQTTQNKCVRFCLNLDKMAHISQNEFEKLNWLSISDRINQYILLTTFKFVNDIGPNYMNKVFQWAAESDRTL